MTTQRTAVLVLFIAGFSTVASGQRAAPDWPQWRGPNRDGVIVSFTEPKAWPERLTQKWKVDVGLGYATPVVVGNRVYMYARQGENETLMAFEADTGKAVWQTRYPAPFTMNPAAARHNAGPKSTPTFDNGRLFTLGMSGIVTAFDAATGKQIWQKPASPVHPLYHTSMSPVVDRGLVIVHVGGHDKGALTAYDVATGAVKWSWDGDGPSYASPIVIDLEGTRQVVTFTQDNLVGVDATTGQLLWKRPYTTRSTQNTITPIVYGQTLIVSGLDKGVTAFRVRRQGATWSTEDVWENRDVSMYMSNGVLAGDVVYGLSSRNSGQFFGLDAKTGKTLWTSPGRQAANAAILRAGNLWFALKDDGELVIARTSATGFEPVHRYTVADSATWAQPAISGNRLFVKDHQHLTLWSF